MEFWHSILLFLSHAWFWVKYYIESHPDQILIIATLIAFLEALPIIGTIFPGSVTMTLVGIFAGRGLVSIGEAIVWTTLGAFVGDWLGYGLGRRFSEKIPGCWPFRKKPHWLQNGRRFFDKHGGKSVILGRFIGPARSTIPMIAGVFGMRVSRFAVAAFFAALFWAIAYLLPGVLIGAVSLQLSPKQTTLFLVTGLVVIVCLWFLFWLIQRSFQWLARVLNRFMSHLWQGLLRSRFTASLTHWLAIPEDRADPSPLERLVWFVICALIFLFLLVCVSLHNVVAQVNLPAFYLFQSIRNPHLDAFFSVVTLTASPNAMIVLMVLLSLWYLIQKDWRSLFFWLMGMLSIGASVALMKHFIHEPRPLGFNYVAHSNGFPSGHTALSTVAFGLLVYWTTLKQSMGWRSSWRIFAVIWLFLIGVSRLYLGAHWLWDVVGAYALASAVWLLVTLLYRRTQCKKQLRFEQYSPWVVLFLVIATTGLFVWKNYDREVYRTTPFWEQKTETLTQWLQNPHRYIPQFMNNRFGQPSLPMNIQWVGDLTCVRQELEDMGWRSPAKPWDVTNLVKRLTQKNAENHLPILKRRFEGKTPDLVLIKTAKDRDSIFQLYLWTSAVRIDRTEAHVLVGFINQRHTKGRFKHVDRIKTIQYRSSSIAKQLGLALVPNYEYKRVIDTQAVEAYTAQGWIGDTWLIYPVDLASISAGSLACP